MGNRSRYKRLTDLGVRGIELRPDPDTPLVYIQKLNSFEMEESRRDAQVARSRVVMALRKEDGDEMLAMRDMVTRLEKARLVEGIVGSHYTRNVGVASNAIYADPTWHERLDIMDRTNRDTVPDDEKAVLDKINGEYLDELTARVKVLEEDERERLTNDPDEALHTEYIETFVETRASATFMREMRYQEVLFGVRMCDAEGDMGPWDHTPCQHERLYEDVEEVRALSDELLAAYGRAFDQVNVPGRQAKGSASRQASSEPSRPPSVEEASAPSTQEAPSGTQGGTSA